MLGSQLNAAFGNSTQALALLGDLASSVSAAGTSQGTATLLTASHSIVTTVGAGAGVRLPVTPTVSANDELDVSNHGANTLAIYPPTSGKLNNNAANVPLLLAPNRRADFRCIDGTSWTVLF